jgi:hypothetical protein
MWGAATHAQPPSHLELLRSCGKPLFIRACMPELGQRMLMSVLLEGPKGGGPHCSLEVVSVRRDEVTVGCDDVINVETSDLRFPERPVR